MIIVQLSITFTILSLTIIDLLLMLLSSLPVSNHRRNFSTIIVSRFLIHFLHVVYSFTFLDQTYENQSQISKSALDLEYLLEYILFYPIDSIKLLLSNLNFGEFPKFVKRVQNVFYCVAEVDKHNTWTILQTKHAWKEQINFLLFALKQLFNKSAYFKIKRPLI